MNATRTTCPYCGVGCGVIVDTAGGRIVGVRGDPDHPANRGALCSKGTALAATTGLAGRALWPELRTAKDAPRRRVGWDDALRHAAQAFAGAIHRRGPDAVAFYLSGQLLTEDYAVFNKLARALVGTNNVDSNSRLCMSSAVSGYKATLGADAPPCCYDDVDRARCFFIAGSNAAWAHPVLFRRIEAAKARDPSVAIVVVDPRRTVTAEAADLHLAIRPGTDVALFNAMLHVMVWEDLVAGAWLRAHTRGFDDAKAAVREFTPAQAAELCGVRADDVVTAARLFATSPATLSLWCQGLNQSAQGTAKNAALINLHLATGQIGRPGAGPFSLTGQPNAMGGRETGAMATLLPGHRDPNEPRDRAAVAAIWGADALSPRPGLTAVELFTAAADGAIDALWIACTNPAQSLPDLATVRRALERTPFVVVQEAFATTETVRHADLLLPASTWGEKEGTVTNSERRISRVRAAVAAPGEARADWRIAADFARALAAELGGAGPRFDYAGPADVFDEHRALTRGRDLDIGGIDYARLDRDGPQQWPCPDAANAGKARLYGDAVFATPDGRARFAPTPYAPPVDRVDARHPLRLSTGRLRDQWHGMSRTGRAPSLAGHAPEPRLALHPSDIALSGLAEGEWAMVRSRRGAIAIPVEASTALARGQAFLPMHWGRASLIGPEDAGGVNEITCSAVDPASKQPELKHAAIRVERAAFAYRAVWFRDAGPDAIGFRERVRALAEALPHAIVALHDGPRPLVLLRVGAERAPEAPLVAAIDASFGVADAGLRYDAASRGVARVVVLNERRIAAVKLCGDLASEAWLRDFALEGRDVHVLGFALVRGDAQPPVPAAARGATICQCHGVSERAIRQALPAALAHADPVAALGAALGCGTQCGSCRPEVRRLVAAGARAAAEAAP